MIVYKRAATVRTYIKYTNMKLRDGACVCECYKDRYTFMRTRAHMWHVIACLKLL